MCRKLFLLVCFVLVLGFAGKTSAVIYNEDVGNAALLPGSAEEVGGVWTVAGSGGDIWGDGDNEGFHYVFQRVSGDCTLEINLKSMEIPDYWTKVGVMIRETLDADSRHAAMVMTEDATALQLVFRQNTGGGSASMAAGGIFPPKKLRIKRVSLGGGIYQLTGEYEVFPGYFGELGPVGMPMDEDVLIGLVVCSHRTDLLCTAVMDQVVWSVTPSYRAWAPSPDDGATGLPQGLTLSWRPGEGATSHDVYLGTNSAALALVATKALGDESYDTGALEGNTTYYWQIVEQPDNHEGLVWSFKTAKVLRPGTGTILREIWEGIDGGAVWDLTNNAAYPDSPTWSDEITLMDSPDLGIDSYGGRMQGWLVPETDGWCTFWIAADDGSALWLSSSDKSGSAVRIAHWEGGYSGSYDAHPEQMSVPIYLEANEKYFIRALWKEGGGGDWCAVAWQGPDTDTEESPARVVIDGYYLGAGYVDLWAYNPSPALGATRVSLDAELSWSAGEDANSHEVWFGTNPEALTNVATKELGDESYDPGPLELNTTYYWQIVEVNDPDVQVGDVWYFSTPRVHPFTGTIARDVFEDIGGGVAVSDLTGHPDYPENPTWSDELTVLDVPDTGKSNFGAMMEGYLLPETDGVYRFWIASDDASALYLNLSGSDPSGAVLICQETGCCGNYDAKPEQSSALLHPAGIPLVGGQEYYIRVLYKEGGGGDWCKVAWSGPDTGSNRLEIDGYYLMPRDWASTPFPKDGSTLATREAELNGLSWWAAGNYADSYNIYLGAGNPGSMILIDAKPVGDESCVTGPLVVDTTYYWRVDQVGPGGTIPGHVWSFTTAEWVGAEVGGSWGGSYEVDVNGVWTIVGDGGDIWSGGDNFYFVYKMPRLLPSGDVTLIARVESLTGGDNSWRKAGMMVRESLEGGSRNACIMMTPPGPDPPGENRISFQSRPETNGGSGSVHYNGVYTPEWVKLVRNGDMFTGFHAEDEDGSPGEWRQVGGPRMVVMPKDVYVGMAVTSHNWGQLTTAVMDNISITPRDPQQSWGPSPADGAEGVTVGDRGKGVPIVPLLNWEEGDDVVGHLVWFSDNYDDVASGASGALKAITIEPNYDPGILDLTETYYWAIDEISSRYDITLGDIWSFTMSDYRFIEDFERYDIIPVAPPHYIEEAGYTADPLEPPDQVALPPVVIDDGAVIVPDAERGGQVLALDGDGDYVDCGNPAELNFSTGDWSVSVWMKSTVGDDQGAVFGNGGDGGGGIRYTLGLGESNADKITLVVDDNFDKIQAHSGTNVADDAWHNVIGVRDVNIIRVYIDGVEDGNAVIPDGYDLSGTSQREVLIGAIWHHGDNKIQKYYTGLIDDVMVYDNALTQDNVDYLAGLGGTVPSGLLAHWAFEGDFTDSSGNGFDGTPHGYLVAQGFVPMLAYYRFDDDNANDYSGNERHGSEVVKGDWPKYVDSQAGLGRALEFNDDGDCVLVSDTGSWMDGLSAMTVSLWIKSEKTDRDEGFIHFGNDWNDSRSFRYDKDGGSSKKLQHVIKYGVNTTDGKEEDESSDYVQTKDWQHVVMTWESGAGKKLYIDGVLDDAGYVPQSIRGGTTTGYSKLYIGKGSKDKGGGDSWNGLVDEVRIYNYAVSYREVRWLASKPPLDILPVYRSMVAEYLFDTDARDTSGNELDGTLEGGAYVDGDGVLNLDGSDDYVDLGNKAEFNPQAKPFSISAWFKMSSWGAGWGSAIISNRGEGGRGWQLRRRGGSQRLVFTTRGCGNDDPGGNIDPSLGEWHHVIAIRDGDQKTLYIDGVVDNVAGINNNPIQWAGQNTYIGARANNENTGFENAWFNGMIDDVRIYYDRALTDMDRLYLSEGFEPTTFLSDTWTDSGEVSSTIAGVHPGGDGYVIGSLPHWGEHVMRIDCNGDGEVMRVAPFEDWYDGKSKALVLYFKGDPDNAPEDMYVKLTSRVGADRSSQLSYDGDINDLKIPVWQEWNIELAELGSGSGESGVPLPHIANVAIGLTGTGTVYFDDLRLVPPRCVPEYGPLADFTNDCKVDLKDLRVMADDWLKIDEFGSGLIARYEFEGNYDDSSGNGRHGTPVGAGITIETDPTMGQVLSLPGGDNVFVEVGAVGNSGNDPVTIACWAKADNTSIPDWTLVFGFTGTAGGGGGTGSHFNIGSLGGPGGVGAHVWGWEATIFTDEEALEWRHYAMTFDGTTIKYYGDAVLVGQLDFDLSPRADRVHIGSRVTQGSSFPGDVDDARVYRRALSDDEIVEVMNGGDPLVYIPLISVANLSDDEPQNSKIINFKDFGILADQWLDKVLWP